MQVRALVHTGVVKYLEFKAVDGSYVLAKNRVERVPATDFEALKSPLMGLFEKRRARNFFLCALGLHVQGNVVHISACCAQRAGPCICLQNAVQCA